jgi:hypothetical protein
VIFRVILGVILGVILRVIQYLKAVPWLVPALKTHFARTGPRLPRVVLFLCLAVGGVGGFTNLPKQPPFSVEPVTDYLTQDLCFE